MSNDLMPVQRSDPFYLLVLGEYAGEWKELRIAVGRIAPAPLETE
jgi:hypothetical protein